MDSWRVFEAAGWAFVGGTALIVGAVLGVVVRVPARLLDLLMALGGGVLVSALAFELTTEALERGGRTVLEHLSGIRTVSGRRE